MNNTWLMQQIKLVCHHKMQLYGWISLLSIKTLIDKTDIETCLQILPPEENSNTTTMPEYISISPEEWAWLLSMGLDERQTMAASDGAFLLGWSFSGWADSKAQQFCGFSPLLASIEGARGANLVSRYWRNKPSSALDVDLSPFSLNGQCAANNRLSHPVMDQKNVISTLEYGVQLSVKGLCESLKKLCHNSGSEKNNSINTNIDEITISISADEQNFDSIFSSSESNNVAQLTTIIAIDEHAYCIERSTSTTKNTYRIPLNTLESIFDSLNHHQITAKSLSLSLPKSGLILADAGISTLRQYMLQIGAMMPTERGWLKQTQKSILQNLTCIDRSSRAAALMPFFISNKLSLPSKTLKNLRQCFIDTGTIEETEYPLFDQAIIENMLLAFGLLPISESPIAHLLADDQLENMVTLIARKIAQVAQTLPSHQEYLERYLSEY